jgi:hypothetical protein
MPASVGLALEGPVYDADGGDSYVASWDEHRNLRTTLDDEDADLQGDIAWDHDDEPRLRGSDARASHFLKASVTLIPRACLPNSPFSSATSQMNGAGPNYLTGSLRPAARRFIAPSPTKSSLLPPTSMS